MSKSAESLCEKIDHINEKEDIKSQLKNLVEQVDVLRSIIAKYEAVDTQLIPITKIVTPELKAINEHLSK